MAAKKKAAVQAVDMSAAVEPTVRIFTRWTPELVRSAELQADGGTLRLVANLCDWLLADDRVSSTLRTRVQALLGLEPTFEKSGDKRRANRAIKALDVEEDWWEAYPESELTQLVTWGLLLGVKPARHYWTADEEHGGRVLPMPQCWHAQHLRFDNFSRTWRIWVAASGGSGQVEEELVPGGGEWILHTPFGVKRPWSMGLWRALAPLVLLKQYARQDWAKISERGILLTLTCLNAAAAAELQGYTKDARKQLAADIYARGSQSVAALPPGIDLKAVQAAINSKDVQGALIEMADNAIAIVVRGGNLSTNVGRGAGSRAATETQTIWGDQGNLRFDAQSLTTTLHSQSLNWWAQFNYGDASLAPWPVYPVDEDEDLKKKTEVESGAFANLDIAERLGFEVDRGAFLEEHRISWAKAGVRHDGSAPIPSTWTLPVGATLGPKMPAPVAAAPNAPPGAPPDQPITPGQDGKAPAARALTDDEVLLASRAVARKSSGFVSGQLYADDVADTAAGHASEHMRAMVAELSAIISKASSYDEVRRAVTAYYRKRAPADKLAALVEKAMVLAQLGGAAAVREDVSQVEN